MAHVLTGGGSADGTASPTRQISLRIRVGVALVVCAGLVTGAAALGATPGRGAAAAFSLLTGAALGFVFQRGRFCFFCIQRDYVEQRDSTGLFAVLTALAVGGVGYAIVFGAFLPNAFSGRLPPGAHIGPVSWALVAAGVAFGLGMALSGACISGHLYRLGEGYSRALPALVGALLGFGLGFYTWNALYLGAIARAPVLWLPAWLGYGGALAVHLVVLGGLAWFWLRNLPEQPARPARRLTLTGIAEAVFGRRWPAPVSGTLVGLIGVFAYFRVEPLGVTAQLGSVTRTVMNHAGWLPPRLNGLDTLAGCATQVIQTITDNGYLIGGLVAGALVGALLSDRFRPSRLTLGNAATALLGGVLMGWGSMTALGCTVGTLLSGISAFALSGWVFAAAVFVGVWLGIKLRWVH